MAPDAAVVHLSSSRSREIISDIFPKRSPVAAAAAAALLSGSPSTDQPGLVVEEEEEEGKKAKDGTIKTDGIQSA